MSATCSQCGASLRPGAKFCTSCGGSNEQPEKKSPRPHQARPKGFSSPRWLPWLLVTGGVVVLVITIWFVLIPWGEKSVPTPSLPTPSSPPTIHKVEPTPSPTPQEQSTGPLGWQPDSSQNPAPQQDIPDKSVGPAGDNPQSSESTNQAGVKAAQAGKMEEAAHLFEKAIRADPRSAKAYNNLGLAKRKLGHIPEAIKAYRQAVEVDPSFALAYKNLGIALEQNGDKQGAVKAYQKYAGLNPSAPDLKAVKESITKLMTSGTKQ